MATLIDTLLVSLKIDNSDFKRDAGDAIKANNDLADSTKKATAESEQFAKSINNGIKALAGLFSTILVSTGLQKLIDDTAKANDQLNFLSKNLGMNAAEVKRWQGAAEMSGGSADGMAASLSGLNKSLWDMVTMGDTSVLPYFNALNVGVVKSNGELRNLDDILLDVSDSLSNMSRPQAYNFAKNMGLDDGTINMLLQGRDVLEQQLATQKDIIVSSDQELAISRQLNQQNALVGRQWEGLKTLLANYLMPYALKFTDMITGFLGYLNRNRDTAVSIFKAIGLVIGVTLIPLALKAGAAFMGMFAPLFGGVGLILLLAGAITALYDDYDKWKKGEKSLFDWSEWDASITFVLEKLKAFKEWFKDTTIGKWFTDQDGSLSNWKVALGAFAAWFGGKWVAGIVLGVGRISLAFAGLLGWPALLIAGFATAIPVIKSYIDDAAEYFGDVMSKAGEKASLVVAAVHKFNDPNASTKDKVNSGLEAAKGIIPGADIASEVFSGRAESVFSKLFGAGDYSASAVEVPKWDKRIFKTLNGDVIREGGSRAWRNHNEGNLEYGDYARRHGAIGTDGRFAIFPNAETGRNAKRNLLFNTNSYKDLTLLDAIKRYAPKGENKPAQYYKVVRNAVGSDKKMGEYTSSEREIILEAFKRVEGWEAGKEYSNNQSQTISNTKGFLSAISKPLIGGIDGLADNFLGQTDKLKSQSQTVNNRTDVNVGGITVNTTANTISGVADDAADSIANRVYQLAPTMN
ncbi:hypothetical protein [Providencia rettgeri]|uniref:hypothetical protein n=1 Tax=Providencia rettgeri TaxID=587 RepID=UPI001BABD3D3|nr:hypothetical protein [Providencia rettgeri]MBS0918392.1 hypothetical protein [Providencia rettgeri]